MAKTTNLIQQDQPRVGASAAPITLSMLADLPAVLDVATAARMLRVSRSYAYSLLATEQFPVPVLRVGNTYRVPTTTLLEALSISPNTIKEARKRRADTGIDDDRPRGCCHCCCTNRRLEDRHPDNQRTL